MVKIRVAPTELLALEEVIFQTISELPKPGQNLHNGDRDNVRFQRDVNVGTVIGSSW